MDLTEEQQERQKQQEQELLIETLANIADGCYVDHADMADFGIGFAAIELRERCKEERLVRLALLRSMYGSVDELNLRATFALF